MSGHILLKMKTGQWPVPLKKRKYDIFYIKWNAYRVLVGMPGERPVGRSKCQWEDNIKMHFMRKDRVVWIEFIWFRIGTISFEYSNESCTGQSMKV
jgi:hypothetical protein